MVDEFIELYVKKIASNAKSVSVAKRIDKENKSCDITIYTDSADVGRIVGKNGKMVSSIKTLVSCCKAKDGIGYKIVVEST